MISPSKLYWIFVNCSSLKINDSRWCITNFLFYNLEIFIRIFSSLFRNCVSMCIWWKIIYIVCLYFIYLYTVWCIYLGMFCKYVYHNSYVFIFYKLHTHKSLYLTSDPLCVCVYLWITMYVLIFAEMCFAFTYRNLMALLKWVYEWIITNE